MLAFRQLFLSILAVSLLVIAMGWFSGLLSAWLILILIIVNLGMLIAASFVVCSGIYLPVLCSGDKNKNTISITFDDGPDPTITPRVLELLKEQDIKACFFLIGKHIEGNEKIVKRIIDDGHSIGSHSFAHSNYYGFWSSRRIRTDLEKNTRLIESITGRKVSLFRPPFGVTNPNIARAVRSLKYLSIGWNIRSLDGIKKDSRKTINRVMKRLQAGGIILFHDNHEGIITILESIIAYARNEGYSIVPISELLNIKEYED